jgi:hypothetical protein
VSDRDLETVATWPWLRALSVPMDLEDVGRGPGTLRPLAALPELVFLRLDVSPRDQGELLSDLPRLGSLVELELDLFHSGGADELEALAPVTKLPNLASLSLTSISLPSYGWSEQPFDHAPSWLDDLTRLTNLERLVLGPFTDEVVDAFRRRLPRCTIVKFAKLRW